MGNGVSEEVEQYLEDTTETPLHEEYSVDELVYYFLQFRKQIEDKEAQLKEEVKPLKKAMADIEYSLSILLDSNDMTGMRGESGSVHYRNQESVKVSDRMALDDWVLRTGNTEVYESRISKNALKDLEIADPPGTERSTYRKVIVSAPRKR